MALPRKKGRNKMLMIHQCFPGIRLVSVRVVKENFIGHIRGAGIILQCAISLNFSPSVSISDYFRLRPDSIRKALRLSSIHTVCLSVLANVLCTYGLKPVLT